MSEFNITDAQADHLLLILRPGIVQALRESYGWCAGPAAYGQMTADLLTTYPDGEVIGTLTLWPSGDFQFSPNPHSQAETNAWVQANL